MNRFLIVISLAITASAQTQPNTVHYEPGPNDFKGVFATLPPVMHVKSGEIIDTRTADCFGGAIQQPGDTLAKVKMDNPLTGPFYIEGAEPGDTLAIKILQLDIDGNQGVGTL